MDNVFHKYRGDSKFTEAIITSGQVFLATAHQLNDPFECTLKDISAEWMDKQIETGMQAALTGFVLAARRSLANSEQFFGLESSQVTQAIESVTAMGGLAESYDAWRAFIQEQTGHPPSDIRALFLRLDAQLIETGIFSMSADPAHALMWAHYADQHRGLCFGFEQVQGSRLADPTHCLPVIYSDELPVMQGDGIEVTAAMSLDPSGRAYTSSFKLSFEDQTFQRIVTTKPTVWAYEQEFRYIESFGGICDWPGLFVECTFGLFCPEDRRRHYIGLLETHVPNSVRLFEMRKVRGTNALERVPMETPLTRSSGSTRKVQEEDDEPKAMSLQEFAAQMQQLMQQERYGEVIYQTGENLKINPSAPILLHLKATAHGLAQQHDEAFEIFRVLANEYRNVAAGWYGMACALESMEKLGEVVPLLRRASQLDPTDPSIALNLGVHLVHTAETRAEGLSHLQRADRLGHRWAQRVIDEVEGL